MSSGSSAFRRASNALQAATRAVDGASRSAAISVKMLTGSTSAWERLRGFGGHDLSLSIAVDVPEIFAGGANLAQCDPCGPNPHG
jgi:hypothetical protein